MPIVKGPFPPLYPRAYAPVMHNVLGCGKRGGHSGGHSGDILQPEKRLT